MPVAAGLCCKPGGFHIDPVRPVERAVITHGHSDHARAGHGAVLATQETLDMMRLRYGDNFARTTQAIAYGEEIRLGDVTVKFHPAGHVLGSAQIAVSCKDTCIVASGDYKDAPDPTCAPFEVVPCDVFITEATFGLPVFRHGDAAEEVKKLLASVALFPERAHLVGAYSLGKAQRVIALLRAAGYDAPIYLHGAMEKITHYYQSRGIDLGELRPVKGMQEGRSRRHHHAGAAVGDLGYLDPAFSRSGHGLCLGLDAGARPRAAARRRIAAGDFRSRRLGRPDRDHRRHRCRRDLGHPWPGRRAGALVHRPRASPRGRSIWSAMATRTKASAPAGRGCRGMNRFAELLDRLAYEPGRNNKLRLITNYFRATEDPDRGYALAALTGALSFKHAKPGLIRDLIADRTDPVLFASVV